MTNTNSPTVSAATGGSGWAVPRGRLFLGNSLDETRAGTKDNHGRLSGPPAARRPMVEEVEWPAGNSQGEVDRLPVGNAGTSRSRSGPDALLDGQILILF